jgi:hypothetical protein
MKLFEFYEADDDELVKQQPNDTRKVRLTLRHLNKLRKMQEIKKVDLLKRKEFFDKIYSRPMTQDQAM